MSDESSDERQPQGLNMDGWVIQKAEGVVESLGALCQMLPALGVPPDAQDVMGGALHPALYDATKVLAFAHDRLHAWAPGDAAFVMRGGTEAVRMLLHRYRTGKNVEVWPNLGSFLDDLEPLLALGHPENRTQIHELLRRFPKTGAQDPAIRQLADMVEDRTMGNITWENFVTRAARLVADRRAQGELDKASWLVPPVPPVYGAD